MLFCFRKMSFCLTNLRFGCGRASGFGDLQFRFWKAVKLWNFANWSKVQFVLIKLRIIRPHRTTTYIDAAYCYRPSSVVCRSVCLSQSSALQKRRTDRDAVWVVDSSGLKEPCITWRSWSAAWKWAILGKGASHCKVYGLFAVSYTKTAETIEMPFGMLSRVNPRNHVLDRVQVPHKNGQFWGGGHAQTCQMTLCVSCAKTAEPIEMPFGLWIQVVPGKYVLHREYRLAPPSEYDWTVRVRRRCGHMLITLISCYILTTKFESK